MKKSGPIKAALCIYEREYYSSSFFSTLFVTSYMIGVAMKIEA